MLGQCLEKAPVAFLQNFEALCVRTLQSCPAEPANLNVMVRGDQGGEVCLILFELTQECQDLPVCMLAFTSNNSSVRLVGRKENNVEKCKLNQMLFCKHLLGVKIFLRSA